MRFTGSIDIDRPRDVVAALFADPANLVHVQEGFVRKDHVSGTPGQPGAVARLHYRFGGRDMELTERITSNRLPESFEAVYEHPHMDNTLRATFTDLGGGRTRYATEVEYTRIAWVVPRLLAALFPGMFRSRGEKWMRAFKEFAERQPAG